MSARRVTGDRRVGISIGALHQMVEQNDEKAESGHERLRQDYRSLERRVETAEKQHVSLVEKVTRMELTPTDVTKLKFAPSTVVAIVTLALGMGAAQWRLNEGLKSELLTAITAQSKVIEAMQRRQELQQYEIQRLSEAVIKIGGSK